MVLDRLREKFNFLFAPLARKMIKVNPNTITWISLIFAIGAGVLFYFSSPEDALKNNFLLIGAVLVGINGLFDLLDGTIAHLAGKASRKGDFLDHAIDRYSDILIIGGIGLSAWMSTSWIALLAIIGVLLTSYMGTQAQAVGHKREYGGLLGRADRLVILLAVPIIQHLLLQFELSLPYFNLIEWALIYFAVVGNLTAIQRFWGTLKWFNRSNK
jgi:archaetidylinositol phosphate synthase